MESEKPFDIVLVEDNEADVVLIYEVLKYLKVNFHLITCYNGNEALSKIKEYIDKPKKPDLFLLDLNIPGLSGFEILGEIKKSELQNIPVIVFTSSSYEEDVNMSYKLNANAVIFKPTDFYEYVYSLDSIINYWLKNN